MKFFVTALICATFAVVAMAAPAPEPAAEAYLNKEAEPEFAIHQIDPTYGYGDSELYRQKKSYGYGEQEASIPSHKLVYSAPAPHIPCSKAIVVSCAPSVHTAPCSPPKY